MHVLAPTFALEPHGVVLTATFESDQLPGGSTAIHLSAPRSLLGRIDASATPFVPIGALMAAALGEDVRFDAPAAPSTVAGAERITATMAGWWAEAGWRPPAVSAPPAAAPPADPRRGHGLFFSLGVDSWASLLTLGSEEPLEPGEQPLTHLLTIEGTDRRRPDVQAAVMARTRRVASTVGLPLIELRTDARDALDPIASWEQMHGAVLAAFALLLGPFLAEVTIAGSHDDADRPAWGSHVDLDHQWSSGSTRVRHHLGHATRLFKVAKIAADPLALDELFVCWEGGEAVNCGRCPKCLRTMTALTIVGALERSRAFPKLLDPQLVRQARHDSEGFVAGLVGCLPPGALRVAWESHIPPPGGTFRLFGVEALALAGLDGETRVNLGLAGTGWQARTGSASTDPAEGGPVLTIGWGPGEVPLRPARGAHRFIRAAMADHQVRPISWVMADLSDEGRINEPWPAAVASRTEQAFGPGICYLAGIGWAASPRPVLDEFAVGRLLDAARVRFWWRPEGPLDPLRLLESIEHGCLPLQIMPAGPASEARRPLPAALAGLILDFDDLVCIDLAPSETGSRLEAAAAVVLAGSVERDLDRHLAFALRRGSVRG